MTSSAQATLEKGDFARALDLYAESRYSDAVAMTLRIPATILGDAVQYESDLAFKRADTRRLEVAAVLLLDVAGTAFMSKDQPFVTLHYLAGGVVSKLNAIGKRDAVGQRSRAVRNWYIADAALLEGARDFKTLRSQLADARALYPGDAGLLMASGSALETEGKDFDDAAEFYRASLVIDGSNAQGRVRLARVLLRLGDAAASLAELDRMPVPSDERMAYFRELFRASALVALKRPPDAERKFVSALEWNAQAPYLGIAESMAARGDDAGARKVIAKLLTADVDQEPWAAYLRGQWRYFPELIIQARQALK